MVYVTATFPYIVLVILFIRNLMLPGAKKGIEFYVIPEWHRLKEAKVSCALFEGRMGQTMAGKRKCGKYVLIYGLRSIPCSSHRAKRDVKQGNASQAIS